MTEQQVGIIGLPFDENSSFIRGPAEAPPVIKAELFSAAHNMWSEGGLNLTDRVHDAGSVAVDEGEDMFASVESAVAGLLEENYRPISLGGDHAVTVPIIRAFARRYPQLSILHFDAHPDLYDDYEGNRYSHACPFSRILEEKLIQRLVQVGIRAFTAQQRDQAARFNVEVMEMKDWDDERVFEFDGPVYISFDVDGLDPACAPGVSHREPGGFTTRQALTVIQSFRGQLVGADIVEFNPHQDFQNMTAVVCAKLCKELAARMLMDR
jgi:agmatinase